jgi:hypothetical protein
MFFFARRLCYLLKTLGPALWQAYFYRHYGNLVDAIVASGSLWIKLGQWLSIRGDILPEELCKVLCELHCDVNYHSPTHSERLLRENVSHNTLQSFDRDPFNSGSIAQIHSARLRDGTDVVVKIVHPRVKEEMDLDMRILYKFSKILPVRIGPILKQFRKQTDLRNEAKSIRRFQSSFGMLKGFRVPELFHSSEQVLIMSRLEGTTQAQFESEHPNMVRRIQALKVVAYYKMVCQDNYVHGDFHPGNILCNLNQRTGELELGIIDPAPCIRLDRSKSAVQDYFRNMIAISPQKLCKLFMKCNANKGADLKLFKRRVMRFDKKASMDALKIRIFAAIRESGMVLEGDLSFLLISFFLVHHQVENYRRTHLDALKYIIHNKVFDLYSVVGPKIGRYISMNNLGKEVKQKIREKMGFMDEKSSKRSFCRSNSDTEDFKKWGNDTDNFTQDTDDFKKWSNDTDNFTQDTEFEPDVPSIGIIYGNRKKVVADEIGDNVFKEPQPADVHECANKMIQVFGTANNVYKTLRKTVEDKRCEKEKVNFQFYKPN